MLIGITGTDGAGKGTVVDYLVKEKGFFHCSARAIFVEELNKRGQEATRTNLRLVGNEMREKFGNDVVVTFFLKKIAEEGIQNAIIESIRAVACVAPLKQHGGVLIAVDADTLIRYERVQARRSETDKVSYEQFLAQEDLEINDPNPHGMQKRKVMDLADYTIMNNGSQEEFHARIEEVYAKIVSQNTTE